MTAVILATIALGGCREAPTEAMEGAAALASSPESASFLTVAPPSMERGIEALIESAQAAWNAMDGIAYGAHFAEDAEVINPPGAIVSGRTVIANTHVFLFNPNDGPFRGSTSASVIRRIVPLTGTMAIVDATTNLTGYASTPNGLVEWAPGVVRTRNRMLVVRNGARWEIQAQQLTAVQPFILN